MGKSILIYREGITNLCISILSIIGSRMITNLCLAGRVSEWGTATIILCTFHVGCSSVDDRPCPYYILPRHLIYLLNGIISNQIPAYIMCHRILRNVKALFIIRHIITWIGVGSDMRNNVNNITNRCDPRMHLQSCCGLLLLIRHSRSIMVLCCVSKSLGIPLSLS